VYGVARPAAIAAYRHLRVTRLVGGGVRVRVGVKMGDGVRASVRARARARLRGVVARLEDVEGALGEARAHLGISEVGDHRDALQAARVLQRHLG
jgi:hypothetical protein